MILHLVNDEKFINTARTLFESVAPGNNQFLLYKEDPDVPCIHVSASAETRIIPCNVGATAALIDGWKNAEALVVHMLTPFVAKVLLAMQNKLPALWLAWGIDIYNCIPTLQWRLYQPRTLRYVSRRWPHRATWYSALLVRCLLQKLGIHRNQTYRKHFQAIKRFQFCAAVYPTEDNLIRKHCGFEGKFLNFTYGDYGIGAAATDSEYLTAGDVFVGNSSTPTSNHLDAFALLKRFRLGNRKVVVPLSYGDCEYRQFIIKEGRKILGDRFVPIVDFMRLEDYTRLIKRCGVHIFNHGRQQASGTIMMSLWLGARVCLPARNPGFPYFQGLGAKIFDLENELRQELLDTPLNESIVEQNRSALRLEFGQSAVLGAVGNIVRTITGKM